jgi:hypothetical protein
VLVLNDPAARSFNGEDPFPNQTKARGVIENEHSTDIIYPPLPRVCMRILP